MQIYANRGGDSGIAGYELGTAKIDVFFMDHSKYRYTDASAGAENIRHMHQLAEQGEGLNAFINQHVKYGYESKGVW